MNTRTFCRIKENNHSISLKKISNQITNISIDHKEKNYEFNLNHIWSNYNNEQIFNELHGYSIFKTNFFILFGFTGTGKTYTTLGILHNLLYFYQSNISISAIQIYRNDIFDLINNTKLKYFKTTKLVIKNKSTFNVNTPEDIDRFLYILKKNRAQSKTNYNHVSSRSHAIIYINTKDKNFVIVDMAGQESGVQYKNKKLQNEGTNINLNMLALKECIRAIYNKDNYIPFRRTLLSFALKPMFSGNHFLAFICTISNKLPIFNQIDSLKYSNQLFKCSKPELLFDYSDLVKDYTEYIQETGWYGCEEIKLWREIKDNNYTHVDKIQKFLEKKLKWIQKFKGSLAKYQKINPELDYQGDLNSPMKANIRKIYSV